jgi:hypothetical protein
MTLSPCLDRRAPLEAPVAIPIILRRGDHSGEVDTGRLEACHRLRQINEAVVVATGLSPKRFAYSDRTAAGDHLRQRVSSIPDMPPHEGRTEAQRDVV